jgi:hypothetical protein
MTNKERYEKWKSARTPQQRLEYGRKHHKQDRETTLERCHRNNRKPKTRYRVLKYAAKNRNLECSLSFVDYFTLISNPCFYCGGPLSETGGGLDRINNDIGYVKGNVRPCCHVCNQAKSSFTEAQFREWALRLYNNYVVGKAK